VRAVRTAAVAARLLRVAPELPLQQADSPQALRGAALRELGELLRDFEELGDDALGADRAKKLRWTLWLHGQPTGGALRLMVKLFAVTPPDGTPRLVPASQVLEDDVKFRAPLWVDALALLRGIVTAAPGDHIAYAPNPDGRYAPHRCGARALANE
jgi:hypothetical protein